MRHIDLSSFPKQTFRPLWRAVIALLLGIAAFCTVAVVTVPPGPGLDPDALSYLGAAESLVARGAYRIPVTSWAAADSTEPLVHFPPGFPTLIAGPVALGMPAVQAGRLVECVSAFVTAALAFLIVETTTGAFAGLVAVVALFAAPAILGVYMSVVSEPPFIAALLATLGAMVAQRRLPLDSRARRMAVAGAGLAAAAAIMLRYAGVAVVGAAALWPLAARAPWRRRLSDGAVAIAPAAFCAGLWVYRIHRIATGPAGNIRTFRFYGGVRESVLAALATLCGVVLPGFHLGTPTLGFLIFAVAASVVFLVLVGREVRAALRGPATAGAGIVIEAAALMGVSYVTVLLVSRAVADPGIPFDERILAPLVVLLILVVIEWICLASHADRRNTRSPLLMGLRPDSMGWLVGLVWLAAAGMQSAAHASDARDDGLDIAEARFRTSETIGWVRANGSSYALYTNWPSAIYFHAHRATHDLPATLDALTLRRFHDRLVRQHGIVVALDVPNQEMAPADSLAAKIPLQLVARLPDGAIWGP